MNVEETLKQLEQKLLTIEIRHDGAAVASLLADEFREFGSSGKAFSKTEIIDALQSEAFVSLSLTDFEVCRLSDEVVLVTYRAIKGGSGLFPAESLRSSLWIHRDGRWQMLFHQGTRIPE